MKRLWQWFYWHLLGKFKVQRILLAFLSSPPLKCLPHQIVEHFIEAKADRLSPKEFRKLCELIHPLPFNPFPELLLNEQLLPFLKWLKTHARIWNSGPSLAIEISIFKGDLPLHPQGEPPDFIFAPNFNAESIEEQLQPQIIHQAAPKPSGYPKLLPIQIDGIEKASYMDDGFLTDGEVMDAACGMDALRPLLEGKEILKVIMVPGKLINIVTK